MKTLKMKLTPQAVGAVMLALQKGTMAAMMDKSKEECDITGMLLDFELEETQDGLIVLNPPTVSFEDFADEVTPLYQDE